MRKRVRGAPSLHVLPVAERFFEFILDKWGPSGGIYAAVMEKSGKLIAYELGFRQGKALLAFNKAYEPSYAHYSPGTMLIPSILDFGYKRGYQEYNLGRGDQAYKHMWTENFRQNLRIEIWNNRLCSRVAALLDFGIRPIYCHFLSKLGIRYVPDWDL
jgi:CelD/BcsL family acetyltransferase involved in cellulose biosynthesis